ncbi:MAG: glycerol-3-phosphate dehydrogenase/oxidase [Planctomycetes bacterium]|nr:glycerol-3-phosphate dehydrogenase/oxidase [Planctomycetota bacterium]
MLRTDPRELERTACDLLVVGAGIQGAAIAREAAVRGLSVVLCDRRDVAAGTSSRSSRLVHGGLRYLQHGHFALVREALHERERLLRSCPHLVRPVPMILPFHRDGSASPWRMRLGTWLYARLAGRSTLPAPRHLSATAAAAAFPGLRTRGLRSALEFFDAATQDTRLTLANVLAAHEAGARIVTHCAFVGVDDSGARLVCGLTGAEVAIGTRHIVNAAGPGADGLRRKLGCEGADLTRQSRGSHLVLPPRDGETALAGFLPDGRIQFVIPHRDGTLCGTTDVDSEFEDEETGPPAADLDYLYEALQFLLDPVPGRGRIGLAYAGWRSLPATKGPPGAINREAFIVTEAVACGELHTVVGGKLTTHRAFAERTVARLFGFTGVSPTRSLPLPGGDGPSDVSDPLWWRYGSRSAAVHRLLRDEPALAGPLCPHRPFLRAEAVHALRHEGAVTFTDLMLRRLVHGQGPCLDEGCLLAAHELFRRERVVDHDSDLDTAVAWLLREVAIQCGDLTHWRDQAGDRQGDVGS